MKNFNLKLLLLLLISTLITLGCQIKDNITDNSIVWTDDKNGTFTDPRDNQTYKVIKIGNQILFAENLKYQIPEKEITDITEWKNNNDYDGWSFYRNNLDIGKSYGILYQWEAAKLACPNGWHLMTDNEWSELINNLGDEYTAGNKLKEIGTEHWYGTNVEVTNESGFTALGGGYRDSDGDFINLSIAGHFWTSTTYTMYNENYEAYRRSLAYTDQAILRIQTGKRHGLSARCVKD